MFSHEKPYSIGWLKASENNNWNIFDVLRIGKEKACYKIMPSHFAKTIKGKTNIDTFQIQTILEHADKVYYLYRRDFKAQIKSHEVNGSIIVNKGMYTLSDTGKLIADRISSDLFVI